MALSNLAKANLAKANLRQRFLLPPVRDLAGGLSRPTVYPLLRALGMVLAMTVCASAADEPIFIDGIDHVGVQFVSLAVGQSRLVAISRSGGTGYMWRLASDQPQDVVAVTFQQSRN